MTNKQLHNIIFENFVQAKKELIREGYQKNKLENVDFNQVFESAKKKMLEERVKSLMKENEMLKRQLGKRKSLKEAGSMSAAGQGGEFQGNAPGSKALWNFLTKVAADLNISRTAILDVEIQRLLNNKEIDNDVANSIIANIKVGIKNGSITRGNIRNEIKKLIPKTLSESKKRRRY